MTQKRSWRIGWVLGFLFLVSCGGSSSGDADVPLPATVPIAAPVPDDCLTDVRPGNYELRCEGLDFNLSVPEVCTDYACGLIVDVHGFGMTAGLQEIHSRLAALGGEAGYIVLQPTAPLTDRGNSWSGQGDNDDQVEALLRRTVAAFHVEQDRIHMTGYSQGGFMTWRFLCERSGIFGSVAPMAAGTQCLEDSFPDNQVDILYGHGTTDGLVPFASSVPVREWIRDGYDTDEGIRIAGDEDYEWTRFTGSEETVFEFLQWDWEVNFALGGRPLLAHCFPGSGLFLGCGADNPVDWGAAVVEFFLQHPRG
jgi:poly(3-hydroxybutyrate) depolymerase